MLLDLPRVEYDDKKKVKKSDQDFVKEQNRRIGKEERKPMTLAEMREKK